jgi:hypothetical protein
MDELELPYMEFEKNNLEYVSRRSTSEAELSLGPLLESRSWLLSAVVAHLREYITNPFANLTVS